MKTATEPETLSAIAARFGITIESSAPRGEVEPAQSKDSKPWPHIAYDVTLKRNGRSIWSGPYRLGIGHVKGFPHGRLSMHDWSILDPVGHAARMPYNASAEARIAEGLAKKQKITPKLDDVLNSLLMDGSAYFDASTFESWCDEYGYDADSRKAEAIWKACDEIGRNLARAFTAQELEELCEAANNH